MRGRFRDRKAEAAARRWNANGINAMDGVGGTPEPPRTCGRRIGPRMTCSSTVRNGVCPNPLCG